MSGIAIGLAFSSAIFMTAKDTVSKKVAPFVDSSVSTFASFAYAIPYYLVVMAVAYGMGWESFTTKSGFFIFIVFRALSDAIAEWSKMHAMKYGELSLVVSLLALYPAILLVTSPLVTHDEISTQAIWGTVLSVVGTLIVLYRPASDQGKFPAKAVIFGLASAVFMSINTSLDRMAAQTGTPLFSGFLMTLLAGVFVVPALLRARDYKNQMVQQNRLFFARGLFEILFMVLKLSALQWMAAPYVVGIQRVSLLFSIVSGRVVFAEQHFLQRLMGGALVCVGILMIVLG